MSTHSTVHVADPAGGAFVAEVCTWIDADRHPGLLDQLQQGTLHRVRRPNGEWLELSIPVAVRLGRRLSQEPGRQRDPDDHLIFLSSNLAHQALEERARLMERMDEELPAGRIETVVGREALTTWLDARMRRRSSPRHRVPTEEPYEGALGSTMMRPFNARDSSGRTFMATVYTSINLDDDPALIDELLAGTLNKVASPHDHAKAQLPVPVALHKPSEQLFVFFVPTSLAHRVNSEKARLLRKLAEAQVEIPRYVLEFETVVGNDALNQLLSDRQSAVVKHTRKTPVSPLPRITDDESDLGETRRPRRVRPVLDIGHHLDPDSLLDPDFEFTDEDTIRLGLRARERVRGPDSDPNRTNPALRLMSTVPHRYPDGREPREGFFTLEGTPVPLVAWQLSADEKEVWMSHRIRLLVQLHNLASYPVVAIVLAATQDDGKVVDELVICLDADKDDHRQFLESLEDRFVMTVALYGPSGSLTDAAQFVGNLELNVARILETADRRIARKDKEPLDWDDAVNRFRDRRFPRIGPMRHPFSPQMFSDLDAPSDTALAVSILSYWSQEPNHRYLVFNQSFSAARFEMIQHRVLEKAVEFGLRLPTLLRRLAAKQYDSTQEEVVGQLLANFAEVHLNLKTNDLDAFSLWENWRLLLEDAEEMGVEVDPEVLDLARSALMAAQVQGDDGAEGRSRTRAQSGELPEVTTSSSGQTAGDGEDSQRP